VAESIRAISLCMRVRSGVNGSDSGARDVWWSYLGLGLGSVWVSCFALVVVGLFPKSGWIGFGMLVHVRPSCHIHPVPVLREHWWIPGC